MRQGYCEECGAPFGAPHSKTCSIVDKAANPPPAEAPKLTKVLRIWVTHVAVIDVPMPADFDLGGWVNAVRCQGFFFSLDRKTYVKADDIALAAVFEMGGPEPSKDGKVLPFAVIPGGAA